MWTQGPFVITLLLDPPILNDNKFKGLNIRKSGFQRAILGALESSVNSSIGFLVDQIISAD